MVLPWATLGSSSMVATKVTSYFLDWMNHRGLHIKARWFGTRVAYVAMGQNHVPPVNIPIPTKIGSKMGGAPIPKWYHWF